MVQLFFVHFQYTHFSSIFSDPISLSNQNPNSSSPSSSNQSAAAATAMEGGVENERAAYKLKGYFDLAKEEIDKAVRAEEWGLIDDAILHYQYAQRILREAIATPVPTYITSRYYIILHTHVLSLNIYNRFCTVRNNDLKPRKWYEIAAASSKNLAVGSSLIKVYAENGCIENARQVFDIMSERF